MTKIELLFSKANSCSGVKFCPQRCSTSGVFSEISFEYLNSVIATRRGEYRLALLGLTGILFAFDASRSFAWCWEELARPDIQLMDHDLRRNSVLGGSLVKTFNMVIIVTCNGPTEFAKVAWTCLWLLFYLLSCRGGGTPLIFYITPLALSVPQAVLTCGG
ncbi:hypothetical protein Nepgr_022293 [Nepenthes gracilis]|uniref:Uncharacterized protein n=1 Tax=Nepenthes gracilis TaxID=150966 RepID=A0AAD3T0N1_NEPGR|nr:hypothetical protein Nepgr_022293 [Nepenthes gracilis]